MDQEAVQFRMLCKARMQVLDVQRHITVDSTGWQILVAEAQGRHAAAVRAA